MEVVKWSEVDDGVTTEYSMFSPDRVHYWVIDPETDDILDSDVLHRGDLPRQLWESYLEHWREGS
jgi:hypothetical protein